MSDRDWLGNRKSKYITLGASNHTDKEREINDFYATDPVAIDCLLDGGIELSHNIWECACGQGHLSEALIAKGFEVKSTDVVDRGYGTPGVDFLLCDTKFDGDILTNPPYKYALEFVLHGLDLVPVHHKVVMFLKLQFLEGKQRRRLFDTKQLKTIYVFSSRILCAKNALFKEMREAGGSAVAYAWYEFEKGYHGDPIVKWIN